MESLERQLEIEKGRRLKLKKELKELKRCTTVQSRTSEQISSINETVQDVATKISSELAPATLKTIMLKQHILDLYKRLGYSEDEAQFNMLREAEEWEALETPIANMLKKASEMEDKK